MRERLIELLEAEKGFSRYMTDDERRAKLADHLIENGVIVPPCKVGDAVYFPIRDFNESFVDEVTVDGMCFHRGEWYITYGDAEYTSISSAFLTREEAENALAEREGKG